MSNKPLVDFDPERVESSTERHERFRECREKRPLAWSEAHGGFWLATRYEDVTAMCMRPDIFSSAKVFNAKAGKWEGGTVLPVLPIDRFIPSETDSPEWDRYRGALNPYFSAKAVEARREATAGYASMLIDAVIASGHIDFVLDLGNPLSAIGTMTLVGFPCDDWLSWAKPFHEITYLPSGSADMARAARDMEWVYAQMRAVIGQRRLEPKDDVLSALMARQFPAGPLTDQELFELCVQMLGGSIETTTALTAHALMYLHEHREARTRLIENRQLLRPAFDEFLRFFTPVQNLARRVMVEAEVGGVKVSPGDTILMSYASANRDAAVFERPDEVLLNRAPNCHIAMGRGRHFCLGSYQARMMFEVMMNVVFDRMPDYTIIQEKAVRYPSIGNVNGWVQLAATFPPGLPRKPASVS